jgi:hypothetical protein
MAQADLETTGRILGQRRKNLRIAPKSTMQTRVLLIAAERGLTKKDLAKFNVAWRRGAKPRFNYQAFAKAHDISLDWIFDGDLRGLKRMTEWRTAAPPKEVSEEIQRAQLKEFWKMYEGLDEKLRPAVLGYLRLLAKKP